MDKFYIPDEHWSENSLVVMRQRYLKRKDDGSVEAPWEMFYRVAKAVALAEEIWGGSSSFIEDLTKKFYHMMTDKRFLPNSPTLMNAGRETKLQYAACYVIDVHDSMEGIFEALKRAAVIHKSGGGTGFSFSKLREKGALVKSSQGKASGPISFMSIFDKATDAIKQGGTRRGANMGILSVHHPDIEEFIRCKSGGGFPNFNISVAVTESFMKALEKGDTISLISPVDKKEVSKRKARDIFNSIVDNAWKVGDPGIIFIDLINKSPSNPVPKLGPIEATNPCGEQPLYANEACHLGSINLASFVKNRMINWVELKETVKLATRFLDNLVEINPYPFPDIEDMVKKNRRIGLGVMGFADLLFLLRIPYASTEATALAEKLMSFITEEARKTSMELAKERGAFPLFKESIYKDGPPIRNSALTTIAPTGTISLLVDTSSGIEPIYGLHFYHKGLSSFVANKRFEEISKEEGFYSSQLMKEVAKRGTLNGIKGIPTEMKKLFATAHEIPYTWHIKMQAAFQRATDNAVSKTINFPNQASREEVEKAFLLAYKTGCKGITIFRDGCREEQVLTKGEQREAIKKRERPKVLSGITTKVETPAGTMYVNLNFEPSTGEPFELFANIGKAGSDIAALAEAEGRLISLILRLPSEMDRISRVREIIRELEDIGGSSSIGFGKERIRSIPDGIAHVLREVIEGGLPPGTILPSKKKKKTKYQLKGDICPQCGNATLIRQEGCTSCMICDYNLC
ncbi:MAG: adenosylcobalamin-dependent ribonucleoside-diphosphate reductase [Deltaproteobacteria bacterium]|nr:adenosylcobalamin-dependent ribonucleoside-diphosphate reductase [Deltaproteobacteria bacterium]RLA90717.1 MAG: adenosylcobalamin-dependent ribonucleoside-diphosphate reductase [Deltaproteobacteria bacterium]